jgi:acyl-CoA thioesterase
MPTTFSSLLGQIQADGPSLSVDVTDDWLQGRTIFGGLQGALAVRAMRALVPEGPLRTLQATFLAPVPAGRVRARAEILRTGKNTTHVEARLVDEGSTLALMVGVFGGARASEASLVPTQAPVTGSAGTELPFIAGVTPNFTQHFGVRWVEGQLLFTGYQGTHHVLSVDVRDDGPMTESHVFAIADLIPPLALSRLTSFAPGSTLTWMMDLLTDRFDRFPLDGWRVDGDLTFAQDGYTSQGVTIWSPTGEPVALSRQSMLVFG